MKQDDPESYQTQTAQGPGQPMRIVPDKLSIYYSNCAMVATSPVDIALFFGRYVQTNTQGQGPGMAELYERQIYMTIEQAKRLAQVLNQTIEAMEAGRGQPAATQERPRPTAAPVGAARAAAPPPAAPAAVRVPPGQQVPPQRKS